MCRSWTARGTSSGTWRCSTDGRCRSNRGGSSSSGSSPRARPLSSRGSGSSSNYQESERAAHRDLYEARRYLEPPMCPFRRTRPPAQQRQRPCESATGLPGLGTDRIVHSGSFHCGHAFRPRRSAGRAHFQRGVCCGEEISGLELEMRRRDGSPLWISLWMRPMRHADGTVQAVHTIWVDITDRVLAEAERARLQQQNLYLPGERSSRSHNFDGDRRPQAPRCWPCSTRFAVWRRPTPRC